MNRITIRDLRNHGARLVDRVQGGELLIVTRNGQAAAELRPVPRKPLCAATLLARRGCYRTWVRSNYARISTGCWTRRSSERSILGSNAFILLPRLDDPTAQPTEPVITTILLTGRPLSMSSVRSAIVASASTLFCRSSSACF